MRMYYSQDVIPFSSLFRIHGERTGRGEKQEFAPFMQQMPFNESRWTLHKIKIRK